MIEQQGQLPGCQDHAAIHDRRPDELAALGKAALSAERARTLGGIYARHGAKARVGRVIAGAGAGQIYLGIGFEDGKSMGQIFENVQADQSFAKAA
jgi:hypothetical protein